MKKHKKFNPNLEEKCPCNETDKLLKDCCFFPPSHIRKKVPSIFPPSPNTQIATPNCYLSFTNNCSPDLSGEHYMSKSVLKIIGNKIAIGGAPWLPRGTTKEIGINSLTSNILCVRHNSALSKLDAEAGNFFKTVLKNMSNLSTKSISRKNFFALISGEAIEMWMLKVAIGLFYSKTAAKNGVCLIGTQEFDVQRVYEILLTRIWDQGCGLYIKLNTGSVLNPNGPIGVAPISDSSNKKMIGAEIIVLGMEFMIIFDQDGLNTQGFIQEGWHYRPSEILFRNKQRTHAIQLTWSPGQSAKSIILDAI